jgi:hypothetical protein
VYFSCYISQGTSLIWCYTLMFGKQFCVCVCVCVCGKNGSPCILLDTLLGLHNSQDEGILILQNITNCLPKNTKYHPKRLLSSAQHCYKYLKSKFCVYKQKWTSPILGRMNIAIKVDNHKCTLPAGCLSFFSLRQCLSFRNLEIEIVL